MRFPWGDTKLYLIVKIQFWNFSECRVPLHFHDFQVHPSSKVVIPVSISSIHQTGLCANYLYLIGMLNIVEVTVLMSRINNNNNNTYWLSGPSKHPKIKWGVTQYRARDMTKASQYIYIYIYTYTPIYPFLGQQPITVQRMDLTTCA